MTATSYAMSGRFPASASGSAADPPAPGSNGQLRSSGHLITDLAGDYSILIVTHNMQQAFPGGNHGIQPAPGRLRGRHIGGAPDA
jgi:hypothetical protein